MLKDIFEALRIVGLKNARLTAQYHYQKAWIDARWENPQQPRRGLNLWYAFRRQLKTTHPMWPHFSETPGGVQSIVEIPRGVRLQTAHGQIEIIFFAADTVRVRYLAQDAPPDTSYAIAKSLEAWPEPAFKTITNPKTLLLHTEALTIGIRLDNATLFFADSENRLLRTDIDTGWAPEGAIRHRTALAPDEHIFGLGERATPWNRRWRTHTLWNTDPSVYASGDDPINLNIPAYVSVHGATTPQKAGVSYLVFYDNPTYAAFDLGGTTPEVADHRFEGGELCYYFIGGSVPRLLERYTELTGRHPLPPLWMLGYQQSRWSYSTEQRVRQLAQDFRDHEVPCDAIHLDIDYMDGYRDFTWDKARFPNPAQLAADLQKQGIKLITIIDTGVKKDPSYAVYREGIEGDHFCTLPDGSIVHAPVWPGLCAFPDFTAAKTRNWWGEQYKALIQAGIAGFWNDMNEPAAFSHAGGATLPDPTRHHLEGQKGDHRGVHNVYGMQMVRASQEGIQKLSPDKRPVVITRSGWAGVQRYAFSWTGDNRSTWESMRLTIPMVLGLGLSGVGFTGPDTGGFAGEPSGELFTRWIAMSTFMPFFRAHTILGSPDQEPWSYGEPYLSINRRFIQLRYELLPYFYTAAWQMSTYGWPMIRPAWWHDQDNPALWDIDDAFLCGDAFMVAPVGEPDATSRSVTLPSGNWYDFWTNRIRKGNTPFEQFAPLETLPLFVREGTVLPLGEFGPSVEQRKQKFLRLHVYPLAQAGEATSYLYEDAGEGLAYQRGEQRISEFNMRREDKRLIITWTRQGSYRPPYEHIAMTLNGLHRVPQAVRADGEPYPVVTADKVLHTALLGVPPFEVLEIDL